MICILVSIGIILFILVAIAVITQIVSMSKYEMQERNYDADKTEGTE